MKKEKDIQTDVLTFYLANLVELQGQRALLVSCVVLVQDTLSNSLVNCPDSNLVSAIGFGAIAFNGSSLKLLDSGSERGSLSSVTSVASLGNEDALLSGLDIRQTKHLLDNNFKIDHCDFTDKTTMQDGILSSLSEKCKSFS